MASVNEPAIAAGSSGTRAALHSVLRSQTFRKNPRLGALLKYLCECCFDGQAESIKEFNIATDVFGRAANFDQSQDAIVRVEMHRLRKKLAEFYANEGQNEPVEIVLQVGHYQPEFFLRRDLAFSPTETSREPAVWHSAPVAAVPQRTRPLWVVAGLIAAALLAALLAVVLDRSGHSADRRLRATASEPAAISPSAGTRILCGSSRGSFRDRAGNLWGSDAFFSGGTAVELPDQPVYRTRDNFIFRAARTGESEYKIPLKPGVYEMRLYFADQSYSPGVALEGGENTRVFDVTLNGQPLLREFDIISDAGPNTADIRVFKDIHPAADGYLHLTLTKNPNPPVINAIEIVPGIAHRLRPIRIVTEDRAITDRFGLTWNADNYFLNGRKIARSAVVPGSDDPQIYESERYGNFSYAIPVAEGRYRVTLHFAESYWGQKGSTGGGVGTRVFDVYCNGTALLRNFDMLREAPPRTQIVKTFDNLRPNGQGKLLLSFVPTANYANISAIEVLDETESAE